MWQSLLNQNTRGSHFLLCLFCVVHLRGIRDQKKQTTFSTRTGLRRNLFPQFCAKNPEPSTTHSRHMISDTNTPRKEFPLKDKQDMPKKGSEGKDTYPLFFRCFQVCRNQTLDIGRIHCSFEWTDKRGSPDPLKCPSIHVLPLEAPSHLSKVLSCESLMHNWQQGQVKVSLIPKIVNLLNRNYHLLSSA